MSISACSKDAKPCRAAKAVHWTRGEESCPLHPRKRQLFRVEAAFLSHALAFSGSSRGVYRSLLGVWLESPCCFFTVR